MTGHSKDLPPTIYDTHRERSRVAEFRSHLMDYRPDSVSRICILKFRHVKAINL
jgi:hypothetical protein